MSVCDDPNLYLNLKSKRKRCKNAALAALYGTSAIALKTSMKIADLVAAIDKAKLSPPLPHVYSAVAYSIFLAQQTKAEKQMQDLEQLLKQYLKQSLHVPYHIL